MSIKSSIQPILATNATGDQVKTLQSNLGKIGLLIPPAETGASLYGTGTADAIKQYQASVNLPATGLVDAATLALLNNSASLAGTNQSHVSGLLVMDYGLVGSGVTVRLYSIGFGGIATKLAETKTNASGVYALTYLPPAAGVNLEVRAVDAQGVETTLSSVIYKAPNQKALNLVAPAGILPLTSEFQRLAADVQTVIGGSGVGNLAKAQESNSQRDLTLLSQNTGWDARLLALAATSAQLAATTGLGSDLLYALLRAGFPSDPAQLSLISQATVTAALQKAQTAGIINFSAQDISNSANAFHGFATSYRLTLTTAGGVAKVGDLFKAAAISDATQLAAFQDLVFSEPDPGDDFWQKAEALKIPAAELSALQIQGKCFYLTMNNPVLSQKIQQDIGAGSDISQLAEKDYYDNATWKNAFNGVTLPPAYTGSTTDQTEAYAADLARKVRVSFPTQSVARMVEKNTIPLGNSNGTVSAFLKAAVGKGYQLGRTPLNAFIQSSKNTLPALNATDTTQLKNLHRLYQTTPSTESMQVTLQQGFTSAADIAAYTRSDFMNKYADLFPSRSEADLVYRKAQQISAVTFNFFSTAKSLDTNPPVYALSSSPQAVQTAKNSIIEQFPSMQTLFGSMDFCQCDDCRSVLSPAAYFVDLLEFMGKSGSNGKGYTPLDVLIGSLDSKIGPGAGQIPSRRADLGALPLTCENTNTAMPYIDIVNEILEYYVSHGVLDGGVAYDTGSATTDDLTAEPQHILPSAYATLMKADPVFGYPLGLPFDLWLETVRGFYSYFTISLVKVLEVFRPVDQLELFTDANALPYYRSSVFLETLGISPGEYALYTDPNPLTSWFLLYSYPSEAIALGGGTYPAAPPNFTYNSLAGAKTLSQYLGLSYNDLTSLITTGFINPSLAAISFQLQRFGINLSTAFSYTGQPGFPALSAADKTTFETSLAAITQQYKSINPASTFDAIVWLKALLPPNYSKKVLVLADSNSGCNFTTTTLIYADGSAVQNADFLKINLFVRIWKKTGWSMDETDQALQLFFAPGLGGLPVSTNAGFGTAFSAAWKTALVYMAHLSSLATGFSDSSASTDTSAPTGKIALLPLWAPISTTGNNPLYAQIFLTSAVLNIDPAFDDPLGQFPGAPTDALSMHQSGIQGALGLSATDVTAILADAGTAVNTVAAVVNGQPVQVAAFTLVNLSLLYRYHLLATSLNLSITDFVALKGMAVDPFNTNPASNSINPFAAPTGTPLNLLKDDLLFNQTNQFIREATLVEASNFSMEDLRYLLLHQFDPVGKYSVDQNAVMALAQSLSSGLLQIKSANAVPADLNGLSDDAIQQRISSLLPAALLKTTTSLLTNISSFTVSQSGITPGNQINPTAFTAFPEIGFNYDQVLQMQTITYMGVLPDWKKTQLTNINHAVFFGTLLGQIQAAAKPAFDTVITNLLGVWSGEIQYEASRTVAAPIVFVTQPSDPAFETGYDTDHNVQWAVYRGVLTPNALMTLSASSGSADFAAVLTDLQNQSLPAFNELLSFTLGLWTSLQTYQAVQATVTPASAIDPALFSSFPQIQLNYDPVGQTQTLTYQGILTTQIQIILNAVIPAANPSAPVMAGLLTSIRTQFLSFYKTQASGWETPVLPATWDSLLDDSGAIYAGLDSSKMLKTFKAELVKIFSPLFAQTLSIKLITQALSANLSSDPTLTSSLLSDISLLADPTRPGKSVQGAFLALGFPGLSANFYSSPDQSGPVIGTGAVIAAGADVTDSSNADPAITASAHFEGFMQVPVDGPYRFFAELANIGAKCVLSIDAPSSVSAITNPVINYTAVKVADEASQFVTLQGGVAYHFTIDFTSLGAGGGATLFIQGETISKGSLGNLLLYPESAIDGFTNARILLSKAIQLITGINLDEAEVAWFSAHPDQYAGFRLSALPTQSMTGQPGAAAKARGLFSQFLVLADYADLKKGPAGGSDTLIYVFQQVGQTFTEVLNSGTTNQDLTTPWTILGNLTRRDPQIIRDTATQFGLLQQTIAGPNLQLKAVGDFANNKGIRRIWEALQVIQTVGLPVSSMIKSTQIVAPSRMTAVTDPGPGIAGDLRNAVRAQYSDDVWRPVAKSVFDPLRQKKRDALVAYIVRDLLLENEEQLFEYFLVDPGMEPVVQTSRLRLALSSVQTFIQRCLLDLENDHGSPEQDISPSAFNTDWWAWMKRYRVWEANREIFLYPENWMVPELRLDKTDLFQSLEGELLKGDITSDLVEDAFHKYLQGLETRARLDIVATYLEQTAPADAGDQLYADDILHVVGRTHGHPHQYFYRTYENEVWSEWLQITAPVDGDHVAIVPWRHRINLFWVTFLNQSQQQGSPSITDGTLQDMKFSTLSSNLQAMAPLPQVRVQLNWSEYFQGAWSARLCSDPNQYDPVTVGFQFDKSQVFLHTSKEAKDAYGIEGPVGIHLDFPDPSEEGGGDTYSFWVTSKNGNPDFGIKYGQLGPRNLYTAYQTDATAWAGSDSLEVWFVGSQSTNGSDTESHEVLLQTVNNYDIVPCSNPTSSPFLLTPELLYQEGGALVSPFFYKDKNVAGPGGGITNNECTFFVQPDVTEVTIEEWPGWIVGIQKPGIDVVVDKWWNDLPLINQVAINNNFNVPTGDPEETGAIYQVGDRTDWLTNAATTVGYSASRIGAGGAVLANAVAANTVNTNQIVTKGFVGVQGLNKTVMQNTQINLSTFKTSIL
jgi:peptidoglycan hydrolase-like protein with peptidoglycan-binding domain